MHITINTKESCTDIPDCMTVEEIRKGTVENVYLSALADLLFHSWLSIKTEVHKDLQPCWSLGDEIAIVDINPIKNRE